MIYVDMYVMSTYVIEEENQNIHTCPLNGSATNSKLRDSVVDKNQLEV